MYKWIPVKTMLPEPFSYVYITCKAKGRENWVAEGFYMPAKSDKYSEWGNIPILNMGQAEVIAWQYKDIPKPYKEE